MVKHLLKRNLKVKTLVLSIVFLLNLSFSAVAADGKLSPEATAGLEVFKANCVSCHAMNVKVLGPALAGVHTRHSEEWLLKWIRNNEKLRASGDKEAIAVFNENGGAQMNVFENLSDGQINSMISYFKEYTPPPPPVVTPGGETEAKFYSPYTLYILLFLIVVMVIVLLILRRTKNSLKASARQLDTVVEIPADHVHADAAHPAKESKMAYYKKRINPTIFKLAVGAVVLGALATYGFIFGVTEVAVQQGYRPDQPIKYSHKLHAGDLQIDCKYCHSTAEKSKQASIPSVNTCMNCHKGVQLREKYNGEISPEIKKIYAAMDYDPDAPAGKQFGPNPKPIRWVRIHNLPDHAVFNHSQHVKGAGVSCQTCHGPIQEMEVVEQFSTLQMGWCINCHRENNIDVENNPYYEKLHAKIKAEKNNKNSPYSKYYTKDGKINVTAAENGALECSKCHY
jgi:mono/diheme cytochrome c family protein